MTAAPLSSGPGSLALPSPAAMSRRDLVDLMKQICGDTGADRYMLVDLSVCAGERPRILSSNWIFDAIETVGLDLIGRIAADRGEKRRALSPKERSLLAHHGHVDVMGVPVRAGRKRYALVLSAEAPDRLAARAFAKVELLCSYALSLLLPGSGAATVGQTGATLSERERECLFWVAEGKTTDDIALILGVSSGTCNNHLSSAIGKLGARNRALAVSLAIRQGLI
jgi:DNA-binding CsgD family transcriptional regulator